MERHGPLHLACQMRPDSDGAGRAATATLQHFGREVRTARTARGWSLQELATQVGLTDGAISALELGRQWVRMHKLEAIAALFQRSLSSFFPMPYFRPDVEEVAQRLNTLHPAFVATVLQMLDAMELTRPHDDGHPA